MDLASHSLNDQLSDDAATLWERNTLVWGAFFVGVVLGFVAVYIVVAQPMFTQLKDLQRQTVALQDDVQTLVGVRNQAWEAGTLLSDLTALKTQVVDARASLREVKQLRQDLLEESRHTAAAGAALRDLARLQDAVLDQQELTGPAARAVEQLGRIQHRLVQEHTGAPRAEETLRDLDRVRQDLVQLLQLKQQLAENTQDLPLAKNAAGELLSLKDQIVSRGSDTDAARTQANRMFVLQDELTSHAQQSTAAFESLDQLLEIKDKLIDQTPQVADAVQNLELLTDFQAELAGQIQSLGAMRETLLQVVLMESTIGRVAKALEPLTQIANVRRLSDQELREAARTILDNRTTRLGRRYESPRQLSRTAENDPFAMPEEEARFSEELSNLGAHQDRVPDPVPLPLTEQPATN